ncbi:LysR substrate-binding domain-containing protein [Roseateles oligotrophus]|uniref:LysR substrate-binding domain-containing protein n=1 Tax=Roseateles oligotrophus TaxID=1769250 RepID=A0ABT2YDT4_9BURK|nr:LysR substrate-binding domain-containing protein [Roseateles oligotrophus]MCV2368213.1 hypothetical protein [Roseateles oligotrophus]
MSAVKPEADDRRIRGARGIAVLSHALARDAVNAGRLVPVLQGWALPPLPVHAVMSSRLQPASVRAFVDFLAARLSLV